ncbi:MAG: tRNA pseudouridine(13) synthase TruD [Gammaproteobacteria bacterium]|nr:tRNA pseudouridine(13) synthase TruD [Gammaproteobacteria bacterium]
METDLGQGDPTRDLPFAHGGPALRGRIRVEPADFVVEEDLGYTPTGDGEHVFMTVRKIGRNTHDVARALARLAGVAQVAVGYAGLKDRQAVTTQSFTVQLPGRDAPDWNQLADESLQILDVQRHGRKIRRGSLRGNRFEIRIRELDGDRDAAEQRLAVIRERGVPNYFGNQRFGRDGGNLQQADDLFAGRGRKPKRELRGILLSAARAQLFNLVLAERVADATWDVAVDGEVLLLAGAGRQFLYDPADASIGQRLAALDVHPSVPLCGRAGRSLVPGEPLHAREEAILAPWTEWRDGLARFGLESDRRASRLVVHDLAWEWNDDSLVLRFGLVSGAFATSVLREVIALEGGMDVT